MEVDDIKLRKCFFIITIILSFLFVLLINNNCTAEDLEGIHFIGEPSYNLINTITKNNKVIGKSYEINITLHNDGKTKSEILIVNLSDEDDSLHHETFLEPDETQTITFTWSTVKIKNQRIVIRFYPKDLEAVRNKFNSGSVSFTIEMNDNDGLTATSTPGFEAILSLLALLVLILYKKSKIKK